MEDNQRDYDTLASQLNGKTILINDTFVEHSVQYDLAIMVRNHANLTICSDPRYKMSQEKYGYRPIEGGKVILTNETSRSEIENHLGCKIDLEFLIDEKEDEQ